ENYGEYQYPDSVHNFMGYMYNETYRFGVKGRLKTGGFTQTFWVDDIKFNARHENNVNPTPTGWDNRRTIFGGLPNYDLTNKGVGFPTEVKVPYVEFDRPDFNYLIDGVKVSDLIDQIIIERAECIPEILATGVMVLAVGNASNVHSGTPQYLFTPQDINAPYDTIGNFPALENASYDATLITLANFNQFPLVAYEAIGTFYSPDILYDNTSITPKSDDRLFNFGERGSVSRFAQSGNIGWSYRQYIASSFDNYQHIQIEDAKTIPRNSSVSINSTYHGNQTYTSTLLNNIWEMEKGLVISTKQIIAKKGLINTGVRHCQYFREKTNKYGDKTKGTYVPTGAIYDASSSDPIIKVFGGDTFTQKTYLRYKHFDTTKTNPNITYTSGGGGIAFYSQNRVNTQMRSKDSVTADNDFPETSAEAWLKHFSSPAFLYNRGYNIKNGVNADRAFDPSLKLQQNMPVRIVYSAIKPQNSLVDSYREFDASNFKDLDLSFGEIVHMANGNNELIAWQKRGFKLLKFNTRNILVTNDMTELTIGTGAVMAGDDRILSAYGCDNKWSIIEGKSQEGNKMFAWINTEYKKVMRYSYDGTRSLEYIKKMRSFFKNYLDWVKGKDTPVGGEGIHGVWDDEFGELIWTVNGKRVVTPREPVSRIRRKGEPSIGTVFFNVNTAFSYQDEIYEAKEGASNLNFPSTSYWTLISHDNPKYYNEYTIAYNEIKNRFTTFFSFLPKLYLKWENTFHSPMYITGDTGKTFIHNKGDYCSWYDGELEEDGYIIPLVNKYSDEKKNYAAMRAISDIVPERIDFTTKRQISFLTSSEFETREDEHDAAIKEDSTLTGQNDGDTGLLYGKYLKVKFTFKKKVYQKLTDLIIKFRVKARISTT
ncbi:hypothetical protein LCGC14_1759540, partial [marine sediment metagenome]